MRCKVGRPAESKWYSEEQRQWDERLRPALGLSLSVQLGDRKSPLPLEGEVEPAAPGQGKRNRSGQLPDCFPRATSLSWPEIWGWSSK